MKIKRYYQYLFASSFQTVLTENRISLLSIIVKENLCPKTSQSEEVKKAEKEGNTAQNIM